MQYSSKNTPANIYHLVVFLQDILKILFVLKQGDQIPYLLHNVNKRFFNESIPVAERTTIFTDIRTLMTPNNTLNIMEITLLQGNDENPKNHALQWLKKKRGIKCNKVGGYIAEYNFKFFRTENTVGDRFLHTMTATYRPLFGN